MAIAETYTLLALDRYAQIMGMNPVHFNQASGATYWPGGTGSTCTNIFYQFNYQKSDAISREEIARQIKQAEEDITTILGFAPAPVWSIDEQHAYPSYHRPDWLQLSGGNARGQWKTIQANSGKFLQAGRQAFESTKLAAAVTYTAGATGFAYDTATITFDLPAAFPTDECCNIKVYPPTVTDPATKTGEEIRPHKTFAVDFTVTPAVVTITFDGWQLIDPVLWRNPPTTGSPNDLGIDAEAVASYLTTVNVFRDYPSQTLSPSTLYWERRSGGTFPIVGLCSSCGSGTSGSGCDACQIIAQNGCLVVADPESSQLSAIPATYDTTDARWEQTTLVECRAPDRITVSYLAGEVSTEYKQGRSCDPLSDYWAHTIAWLTTARLSRDLCTCGTVQAYARDLQSDISVSTEGASRFNAESILENPLGTRKGEVMAWNRIGKTISANIGVGTI